jgi:hypothetical protein
MRQEAFLVVHPQLSSPNPNFSKLEQQFRIFWSRLAHKLLGRLKSKIPDLQIYQPKKANSEKLGLGIDNPRSTFFFFFFEFTGEQVLGEG